MKNKLHPKFRPLIHKHRYKSLRGGRGGMKSWAVATVLVELARKGCFRIMCGRELQNSISDSVISLLSDTIDRAGYTQEFDVQRNRIIIYRQVRNFSSTVSRPTRQKSSLLRVSIFAGLKRPKMFPMKAGIF